ncbi:hypothetical protein MCOR02_008528 [Pyricularia oryzae]|uniref:XRCC4 coiled-coil domain-containing protein n=3 Tax=Pyricularia TaxID=48558 RepID=A0ABQ8NK23_PYRGI|nr:hypothetical protein OOU_Y34scaffold00155g36 [Pyricularia oryzae Y34]KAH8843751.1 hypothetical protein MCOR01_004538 [Pyricularia oryzae]KAI6298274.1 hypothetical protein MCOR33_005553 [Pyricularia grisea]KAH9431226.1 hypothetical protein MCOR02_008528 [Pyricularia oryzae]KAI6258155.1 hypothetical protein MCOR19_005478 [Pyricularia oryzae]
MSRPHVLRIPRSDEDEGSFVLVHVQPSSSKKARPLDVRIVATEGTSPYVVTLKHGSIQTLRPKDSPCTSEEWEQILESLLLGQEVVPDIHLTAAVGSGLQITVRKKVQRITASRPMPNFGTSAAHQRLGVINLPEDEGEAVELFDWCGLALESTNNARTELASAKAKAEECEQAVSELTKQLDRLVQAKAEHEAALLDKFRLLLNEKKAKIREQHDVIKSGGINSTTHATSNQPDSEDDEGKVEEYNDRDAKSLAKTARRPPVARKPKRKAPAADLSTDSDDGFDVMDVDQPKQDDGDHGNSSGDEKQTSDEDDQATASESEIISPAANDQAKSSGQGKAAAASATAAPAPSPPTTRQASVGKPIATRARKPPPKASAAYKDDGSETESDDEL